MQASLKRVIFWERVTIMGSCVYLNLKSTLFVTFPRGRFIRSFIAQMTKTNPIMFSHFENSFLHTDTHTHTVSPQQEITSLHSISSKSHCDLNYCQFAAVTSNLSRAAHDGIGSPLAKHRSRKKPERMID